jgi:mannose/fructose/N-acetylgalactosamine-specific phosphotransferase system component IIC
VTEAPLTSLGLLLVWGTVVGLDLVSVPQGLLSRPLVSASVAGWLLGDLEVGLRVGAILELFALDVLPVGASRYPEYGPATTGAVLLAAGLPRWDGVGVGVLLGLLVALFAGYSLDWLRHANSRDVHRFSAVLDAGSRDAIRRLQWTGLARDALRSGVLTAVALALAWLAASRLEGAQRLPEYLTPALVGVGMAAALSGALRTAGRGRRLAWLGVGLAAGIGVAIGVGL